MTILKTIAKSGAIALRSDKEVTLIIGNVYSKISGHLSPKGVKAIDEQMRYFQTGAQFSPAFRNDWWDGYIRFFNFKSQTFPTGLLSRALRALKELDIKPIIRDTRKVLKADLASASLAVLSNHPSIRPRPYQWKALWSIFEDRTGVINLPTGTGKTLVINLAIACLSHANPDIKCVIITSGISLLSQLKENIESFQGEEIGFVGDASWDVKRITVASVESLYRYLVPPLRLSKNLTKEVLEKIEKANNLLISAEAIFLDEAHHSPAKTFKAVFYKTINATIRIGTTATYLRAGGEKMLLQAVTGKVIFKRSISWAIKNGYLAKPTIILFEFSDKNLDDEDMEWGDIYKQGVSSNLQRNMILAKLGAILYRNGLSTVLFVQQKEQGKELKKFICEQKGIDSDKILFLSGKDDQTMVRKPVLKAFQKGEVRMIICTRILNEGIDFPEANAGIRAMGQKFEGGIIQQLGRILRKYKSPISRDIDRKEEQRVFWIDICDTHSEILSKQSLLRIKTYESEPEFELKFVSSFQQFERLIKNRISLAKLIKEKK